MIIQDIDNIAYKTSCLVYEILNDILMNVNKPSCVYLKIYSEKTKNNDSDRFYLCSSGIKIYLSENDLSVDNCFKNIQTSLYKAKILDNWQSIARNEIECKYNKLLCSEIRSAYEIARDVYVSDLSSKSKIDIPDLKFVLIS